MLLLYYMYMYEIQTMFWLCGNWSHNTDIPELKDVWTYFYIVQSANILAHPIIMTIQSKINQ